MFLPVHVNKLPEKVPVTKVLSTKAWHKTDSAPAVPQPTPFVPLRIPPSNVKKFTSLTQVAIIWLFYGLKPKLRMFALVPLPLAIGTKACPVFGFAAHS